MMLLCRWCSQPLQPHPSSIRRFASRSMAITRGLQAHLEKSPCPGRGGPEGDVKS